MIKRIIKVIEREKVKTPGTPGILLLIRRIFQVVSAKWKRFKMSAKKDSTFVSAEEMWMCSLFPKKVLDLIIEIFKPSTILDVGCGTGVSLSYFLENGVDAYGIENSAIAIEKSLNKNRIIKHNLNKEFNLKKKFDLVWCFEVIEHIHPDFEKQILQSLINHSNFVLLSAARPGQGGHGHFNEQLPEYWIEKFNLLGYKFDTLLTDRLRSTGEPHSENLLFFKKAE